MLFFLQGFVVGFSGSKIFCLHYFKMSLIDVPQVSIVTIMYCLETALLVLYDIYVLSGVHED